MSRGYSLPVIKALLFELVFDKHGHTNFSVCVMCVMMLHQVRELVMPLTSPSLKLDP